MTLTRTPCDLDTMSLFQDLKLKRRKVDSRCSSDGESVADTSTSSPDMVGPVSPIIKIERESVRSSPSPAPRERLSPDPIIAEAQLREDIFPTKDDDNRSVTPQVKESSSSIFDGGGTAEGVETAATPNEDQRLTSPGAIAYEPKKKSEEKLMYSERPHSEPVRQESECEGLQNSCRPQSVEGGNSVFDGGGNVEDIISEHRVVISPASPRQWHVPVLQRQGLSPSTIQRHQLERANVVVSTAQQRLNSSPGLQRTQVERVNVVVSSPNSNVLPPPTFWVPSSVALSPGPEGRINGVRPELIGGIQPTSVHHDLKQPSAQQHSRITSVIGTASSSSGVLRSAPTVIMGEAGGVRTMIWQHPATTITTTSESQTPLLLSNASTSGSAWSTCSSSGSSGNEETAAQLLLNLGQQQQHHQQQQQQQQQHQQQQLPVQRPPGQMHAPLNMERLWAGDLTQLPASQQMQALNLTSSAASGMVPVPWQHRNGGADQHKGMQQGMTVLGSDHHHLSQHQDDQEEDDQPMICMICEDKATGLHYGIITCEGCKGFFKRTVQNRRVYTCVADGNCEITKAQRNRCQYCRFKKCIEQGMVLQAVREDRMPGGRNSGAVYNLYKVKYKKHKKGPKNGQVKSPGEKQQQKVATMTDHGIPPHLVNGIILKTALTNPSEVVHLRQRLDNTVSSSRDRTFPIDATMNMIQTLIDCDEFQDIATLQNLDELLDHKSDLSEKLCQIGDSIVYKLVQWTKRLPFYLELPVEVHTRLLTHKWHELLVLTTSAYQAIHGAHKLGSMSSDGTEADFTQEVSNNLCTLQTCLTSMMGRPITMDQLRQDVGLMVEKITHVTLMFRRMKLRMEEYVCLKVITMLNQARGSSVELENIQDRYMTCLRSFVEHNFPQHPPRFHELLVRLPEVQSAAALLLESKMFYVPFLLNSAIQSQRKKTSYHKDS